jgi:hypothetical protein
MAQPPFLDMHQQKKEDYPAVIRPVYPDEYDNLRDKPNKLGLAPPVRD